MQYPTDANNIIRTPHVTTQLFNEAEALLCTLIGQLEEKINISELSTVKCLEYIHKYIALWCRTLTVRSTLDAELGKFESRLFIEGYRALRKKRWEEKKYLAEAEAAAKKAAEAAIQRHVQELEAAGIDVDEVYEKAEKSAITTYEAIRQDFFAEASAKDQTIREGRAKCPPRSDFSD